MAADKTDPFCSVGGDDGCSSGFECVQLEANNTSGLCLNSCDSENYCGVGAKCIPHKLDNNDDPNTDI